jgi:hypothetical protein
MTNAASRSSPREAPREIYQHRLSQRQLALSASEQRLGRIHLLRLVVFAVVAFVVWQAIRAALPASWIAVPVALFIGLVWYQSRIERAAALIRRAIAFHERGIARIEHRWQGIGSSGDRFADPEHPYSSDLDLFGRASLFQLLSTARTRGGEARLAAWLTAPAPLATLRRRHEAIHELRSLLDLRERISVLGEDFTAGVNPDQLSQWAGAPTAPFPFWMRAVALVLSLTALAMLIWWFATAFVSVPARMGLLIAGLAEALFWSSLRFRTHAIAAAVEEPAHDLDLLSRLLAELERCEFQSATLKALHDGVHSPHGGASKAIQRLRRLIELLDSRDNLLLRGIGPLLLWTTQTTMAIEAWRARYGSEVARWLDAVAELEALSSLANYSWEHPADPFPELREDGLPVFDGESLVHPLMDESRAVSNTVNLAPPLRLLIVSGSNMSGKSTLLRTVGVNTVLALAGAPVRAARLSLSALHLGASIRSTDSLEEGRSRFMAEILRLKQVIELPSPVLFLLDELLHGTNSHDRALGSLGLIRALLQRGGIGLVTTHDLSLTRLADELAPAAANVHFEDRLDAGELVFDYRMREGVVTRSNALDLMRAVGLDV